MPHTFTIAIPPGKKKERLDVFLTNQVENATRNKVQRAIREGGVLVNGGRVRPSHIVSPGEVIQITLPKPPPQTAVPENIPLAIIYEDDDVIVVNKPAGLVTHPAYGNYSGTLVNALLFHSAEIVGVSNPIRPGIVHRLDKDTSGLIVAAKSDIAHAKLAKQFAQRTIGREYQAIVWGVFRAASGLIEARLGRSKSDRKKIAVVQGGKAAATEYSVIRQYEYLALVRLKLHTGRTHQIRVHLAHINHPVFGDPTYGGRRLSWGSGSVRQKEEVRRLLDLMPRQALHAKTIAFQHPSTNKRMEFDSPLPEDIQAVLDSLNSAVQK